MTDTPGDPAATADPVTILDFWWRAGPAKWFAKDDAFDAAIRENFGAAVEAALAGAWDGWAEHPDTALALLILLDQFPRNIYRNDPRAFSGDERARRIATTAVDRGYDRVFPMEARRFFYLPFEHSEDMADQERSIDLFMQTNDEQGLFYAYKHIDAIRRFGRFPHRNAVLGRESTDAEKAFLAMGGFTG